MKPTLFDATKTKSERRSQPAAPKGRVLGRFPGTRSKEGRSAGPDERGLLPASGCLSGDGRWTLSIGDQAPRCVSQGSSRQRDTGANLNELPNLVRARLHALGARGRPLEVSIGADHDPAALDPQGATAVLEAAEALVDAGVKIRLITRGAPHPDTPFGRLLQRAATKGGAVLEVGLIAMDKEIYSVYEAGSPPPSERLAAARRLSALGVRVEGRLAPMLPWISDTTAHLEAAMLAFRDAGINLVRAGYYQLDSEGVRQMKKLRPAHRARLRGCFRGEPRHPDEAHLLPRDLRAKGYARLGRIAARAKIKLAVCEETNPDLGVSRACFSVHPPARAPRRSERAPARAPVATARPTGGLFDLLPAKKAAEARAARRPKSSALGQAQLDLFGRR